MSTKNIVPRSGSQGRIGTTTKPWLGAHFDSAVIGTLTVNSLSGSITVTGSIDNASSASYIDFQNIDNIPTLLSGSSQIATSISGAFTQASSSFSTRVTSIELFSSSLDNTFATDIELQNISSSVASNIASNTDSINNLQSDSGSFSSRVSANESNISSLQTDLEANYLLNTTDTLEGDLTVTGTLTAQQFNSEYITSSVIFESGSTKFKESK